MYIPIMGGDSMATTMTSIGLDTHLADEAGRAFGIKNRTKAVYQAPREIVALQKFKDLMTQHSGRLTFEGDGK
jgi:hypothetical protein